MNEFGTAGPPAKRFSTVTAGDSARSVRWLAELCGLPAGDHLPHLVSELVTQGEQAEAVLLHVGWWARHPEPGSNFERANGGIQDNSDAAIFAVLNQRGYDGLLYLDEREIIGHCFFQRHGAELHAFSLWVNEQHRGGNLMATTCFDFVAYASACPGIVRSRFGTGQWADRLLRPLKRSSAGLGWRVRNGGWVEFSAGAPKRCGPAPAGGRNGP